MKVRFLASLVVPVLGIGPLATAAVVGTTGAVVQYSDSQVPSDIATGDWENNTQIREFPEVQNFTLPAGGVTADVTVPGTSPSSTSQNLSTGVIPAGTVVDSYFLHFDPVGEPNPADTLSGSITFNEPVLGLIALSQTQDDSEPILGLPGVTYADGKYHGMELEPGSGASGTNDVLTLSADRYTVSFTMSAGENADELRIVTAVPEPMSLSILAAAPVMLLRRRGTRAR